MMSFRQLPLQSYFTIEKEPESLFLKSDNRYDGAVNTYKVRDKYNNKMFEPVIFSKTYDVTMANDLR